MKTDKELSEVRVFRFDPSKDKEPSYETYLVPRTGHTVMGVLQYIYEHHDASLAFRSGCLGKGSGRCGACPVAVNGVPALSCQVMVEPGMTIEPHPKFELMKDLVIDFNRVKEQVPGRGATVQIRIDLERCVGCKDCVHICPVGVFEVKKQSGKFKSVPVDPTSCCGVTCQMCANNCSYDAISVKRLA